MSGGPLPAPRRYRDPAYAKIKLPRSLRVLRLEGVAIDLADHTIHAYGAQHCPPVATLQSSWHLLAFSQHVLVTASQGLHKV